MKTIEGIAPHTNFWIYKMDATGRETKEFQVLMLWDQYFAVSKFA